MKKLAFMLLFAALTCYVTLAQVGPTFPYSVSLNWTPSVTTGVTGQNVLRSSSNGTTCGTFSNLNTTLLSAATTSYSDTTVVGGNWYCYEVVAVGPTGTSGPSNVDNNVAIPPNPPTSLNVVVAKGETTGNVVWAWSQSVTTGLHHNELWCHEAKPAFQSRWQSKAPEKTVTLTMAHGQHTCEVTAIGPTGTSGPSNQVTITVN